VIEPLLQAERLLLTGMVEQAEELYRRTLEADPRNSIAVVGLARVALERSDERLAYHHACAALEIDPQNAAALRLEARLSEVLATRGEAVERPAWLATGAASPGTTVDDVAEPLPESTDLTAPPAAADARPSEQVMLARNPSMEDHRRRMEEQTALAAPRASRPADRPPPGPRPRPKGRLRRMLGL
jgi:lipopolysaccharide biosynthesis regulator YciM